MTHTEQFSILIVLTDKGFMKPDKKLCLNCGKQISARKKYCDDACRMAYTRNPNIKPNKSSGEPEQITNPNTNKAEHLQPEQPTRTNEFRAALTKTDKTFYDRAMRDFGEPYYKFGDEVKDETCILKSCSGKFKTSLNMLRYCSYQHYSDSLSGRK